VEHSSRKKENLLRPSLIPSLLQARAYNASRGAEDARLFEIADVYLPCPDRPLPDEPARVAMVAGVDYFGLKGIVETLVARLHPMGGGELAATPLEGGSGLLAEGRSATLTLGGEPLGWLGEVSPEALSRWDLKAGCAAAELDLGVLIRRADLVPGHRAQSETPAMVRDLSLVVPVQLPWAELASVARAAAGPHLEAVDWLDTFAGAGVPEGRHSLHFGLRFRHPERTLTSEEVDRAVRQVVEACVAQFEAVQR
jgi:phenylalanyl-tRNA synthetase beta chain